MKFENTNNRSCGNGEKYIFFAVLLIIFLTVFSFSLSAQDTDNMEFWFVAPDASNAHEDRPTFLMITTGDDPATVTISMPANSQFQNLFTETTKSIPANSFWKFEFSTNDQMNLVENAYTSSGTATNKGICITSTAPVSAYYQIDGTNIHQKEIFTLKGRKALGTDFYMPFQVKYGVSSTYAVDAFRQIQIVATENDTEVVIHPKRTNAIFKTPTGTINSSSTLSSRTVKLNKGQTLLWRENTRNTGGTVSITGTRITSTPGKPIAVTLFEDCLQGTSGSIDPIGDQLVPVNNLGKNYIVVKGFSNGTNAVTDNVVVVAVEDGTQVYFDNTLQTPTLNAGDHWTYDLGAGNTGKQAYYINTSKPVYCLHQSATDTEIGGALLPSLYSISGRRITFIKNNSLPVSSMFLVFRSSAQDGFILNNNVLAVAAQSVGFLDWMYAKVDLKSVSGSESICTVSNTKGSFALGYFNGSSTGTSLYGYLSAFGTFSFGTDTIYHCGDKYQFEAPYALSYDWKFNGQQISTDARFVATQSGSYSLTVNQDPYVITDKIYLKLQNFNHILSAPKRLLEYKSYNFSIELNPQKDKDNNYKTTYEWDFGEGAVVKSGTVNDREVEVYYTTSGSKQIFLTVSNLEAHCDTTIKHTVVVPEEIDVLYWKRDAVDHDWNNEENWVDAAQNQLLVVPSPETKVYLPESVTGYYPSLVEGETDWTFYGQPEVNEIVFRYGSELYYQHKLKYNKAYVNYNWGHYNNQPAAGQPAHSLENGQKLRRDVWHILAAPLKKMATGDFSLAGHPFSWQKQFQVTDGGGINVGDFSRSFPTNDIALVNDNNSIAVRMASYKNENGYRQDYLEGLTGVIEIPYFENSIVSPLYPAHNYDALAKKSYFYYFDAKTLRIINSPVGSMIRGSEAYRFVYETEENTPPSDGIYKINNIEVPENTREVMVGNPFLAPIEAVDFWEVNKNAIDKDYGYKLLSENEGIWERHDFAAGNMIPAWKAFIVTLQENISTLSFPLEPPGESAPAVAPFITNNTRSSYAAGPADDVLYVQMLRGGTRSGDAARLQHNRYADKPDIKKMILPDGHRTPEVFFISRDGKSSNLIQQYRPGEKEVAIGIKTSDVNSRLSLEFTNIAAFSASTGAGMILVDKLRNVTQDLTRNPVYLFTQQASGLDSQYVDRHRFVLQLGSDGGSEVHEDAVKGVDIMYRSGILEVTSEESINSVSVYDLFGRLVFSTPSVNLTRYSHPVSLQSKMYLVRVKTVSGKETVRKITGS